MPVLSKAAPEWQVGDVTLNTLVTKQQTVRGRILGGLAVHPALPKDGEGYWTVTSTTTGLRVATLRTEAEAKRLAQLLHNKFAATFRLRNSDAIRDALPSWVSAWLKECMAQHRLLDHVPYQLQHNGGRR